MFNGSAFGIADQCWILIPLGKQKKQMQLHLKDAWVDKKKNGFISFRL